MTGMHGKRLAKQHHNVKQRLPEHCHECRAEGKKAKAPFIRIDGDTPPSERQRMVNDFQQQAGLKVAILSIKAAGTGLTLTVRVLEASGYACTALEALSSLSPSQFCRVCSELEMLHCWG